MADMYNTTCSSSSSPPEPDDISLFLHQILLRSSSSSSSPALPENQRRGIQSSLLSGLERQVPDWISTAESSSGLNSSCAAVLSPSGGFFPAGAANVSSSSVGTLDNEPDEYDCESEEGFEALVEEVTAKPVPARNSSKRSRAAEVHNLSEKRRRSRINEKMKALQNLIPNSNKTDKASMLDEAINYLKQLQLQVQMLTMRNGLSLYPMFLPGVVQPAQHSQTKMGFYEGNEPPNVDMTGMLPVNQENPLFNNQSTNPAQLSAANLSTIIDSETSFGMESSIQGHLRPIGLHTPPEEICREGVLPHQQLNVDRSHTNSVEFGMGAKVAISSPFDTQASDGNDNAPEARSLGTERPENAILSNLDCDSILAPHLTGLHTGRRAPEGDIKKPKSPSF